MNVVNTTNKHNYQETQSHDMYVAVHAGSGFHFHYACGKVLSVLKYAIFAFSGMSSILKSEMCQIYVKSIGIGKD